jgi:hypothetical protein
MAIIKPNNNTISAITALPAAISTGKILNVYNHINTSSDSTNSTSFVASSSTITLTPVSSSSKFFLIYHSVGETGGGGARPEFTFYRDSTNIGTGNNNSITRDQDTTNINFNYGFQKLDSPSTASEITYKMYYRCDGSYTTFANANANGQFTIFEIQG